MQIIANTKPLVVRYKQHGKNYASASGELQDLAGAVGPFDEAHLAVGASVDLEDCDVVGVAELQG